MARACDIDRRIRTACVLGALGALLPLAGLASESAADTDSDATATSLKKLSIDELQNVQVTSVSKTAEPLSEAAAAIYVITHQEILDSGARSIPDMLRLAPNLQVAQITASSFAITARGFNGSAASKLLVLIDGRSVYTPYHSGVSWDVQDVLPEDIERIEVISGPGATLWGANAVNGVINIITRKSGDTQGVSAAVGGGNLEQRASVQYGNTLGSDFTYRAYVDSFHYDHDLTASGGNAKDDWHKTQGGFRLDWTPSGDLVTVQGDFYQGSEDQLTPPSKGISGGNLLARWDHVLPNGSALQIQAYYDYVAFSLPATASDYLNSYDLEIQHRFSWGSRQHIVWGGDVRIEEDNFPAVASAAVFSPQRRTLSPADIFVEDSITLTEALKLVLGTKIENEPYTGVEPLPSARLSWRSSDAQLLWAAVSRAVRAPSRIDRDLFEVVGPVTIIRGGDFQPEKLIAYELGYRAQPFPRAAISISTFYNVYTDLRSVETSPNIYPIMFNNDMAGHTYGAEVWGSYRLADWWHLTAGANWLHESLHLEPGASPLVGTALAGDDPTYQASVGSTIDLSRKWLLNIQLRRIGALPSPASPAYTEANARVAWDVSRSVEISLTASNLLHPHHLEFGTTSTPIQLGPTGVESGRSFFLQGRLRL